MARKRQKRCVINNGTWFGRFCSIFFVKRSFNNANKQGRRTTFNKDNIYKEGGMSLNKV